MRFRDILRQLLGGLINPPSPPPPVPPPPVPPPPDPAPADRVRAVFDLQNSTRLVYEVPLLQWDPRAAAAAQRHISERAGRGRLTHTGKNGSNVGERLRDAGLYWTDVGENIAAGQRTAEAVVKAWFESPGHRENMLDPDYTVCGVGSANVADGSVWWCVVFARARTSATAAFLEVSGLPRCPGPLHAGPKGV